MAGVFQDSLAQPLDHLVGVVLDLCLHDRGKGAQVLTGPVEVIAYRAHSAGNVVGTVFRQVRRCRQNTVVGLVDGNRFVEDFPHQLDDLDNGRTIGGQLVAAVHGSLAGRVGQPSFGSAKTGLDHPSGDTPAGSAAGLERFRTEGGTAHALDTTTGKVLDPVGKQTGTESNLCQVVGQSDTLVDQVLDRAEIGGDQVLDPGGEPIQFCGQPA